MIIDGAILAAGLGTRMASSIPKMATPLLGEPLLSYPLRAMEGLGDRLREVFVVVRNGQSERETGGGVTGRFRPVVQTEMDGTWGAVEAVVRSQAFRAGGATHLLIANGDGPLVDADLLRALVAFAAGNPEALVIASAELSSPKGYGRILRDGRGQVRDIREESALSGDEAGIREVNAGLYLVPRGVLEGAVAQIPVDAVKNERFLTALIPRTAGKGQVLSFRVDPECMLGVNSQEDLASVAALLRRRINRAHMVRGVTFWDPERTDVGPEVRIGAGTVIMPQTVLEGKTVVGEGCRIGLGVHLLDTRIDDAVTVRDYVVASGAHCAQGTVVGPFAHLRPGAVLEAAAHVGNFVEIKQSVIGPGSKVNHLSYIGDATVGATTNIGAGTITCNYDGYQKHPTTIGSGVFIGSGSQLVAPVCLGDRSVIAAGSTIVEDVPEDGLALSRTAQETRPAGAERYHARRRSRSRTTRKGEDQK